MKHIFFYHLRPDLDTEGLMARYGQPWEKLPNKIKKTLVRGTICGAYNDGKIYFAISACSVKDNFCKRIGRNIAQQRALDKPADHVITSNLTDAGKNFVKEAKEFENSYNNGISKNRVRKQRTPNQI